MPDSQADLTDADASGKCPRCGARYSWREKCPRCLLTSMLEPGGRPWNAINRVFGRYAIVGEIGRGGMGRVWRATQTDLNRDVALKTLRFGALADAGSRRRFRREATTAGRLRHPGIVPIYEVGEVDGEPFLAMEWVRGESLAERLRRGPMPPREAAMLVQDLSHAVDHAHAAGVIHRDIKPGNVLLDAGFNDRPRLVDFGIAHLGDGFQTESAATLHGLGTLAYLAPEETLPTEGGKVATDVYGLGAVLYHCLVGRPPFSAPFPAALLRMVVEEEPMRPREVNASIPGDLEAVCLRCLQKKPTERYDSVRELAEDLARYLEGNPVVAARYSPVRRLVRHVSRSASVVGVGIGLVALTATISQLLHRNEASRSETKVSLSDLVSQWPSPPRTPSGSLALRAGACSALGLSPDGRWIAAGDMNGWVRVFDAKSLHLHLEIFREGAARVLQWSRDGNWLFYGTQAGHWTYWNVSATNATASGGPPIPMVDSGAVNPVGTRFFVGFGSSGEFWGEEGNQYRRLKSLDLAANPVGASFNTTGDRLLVICQNQTWVLLDGRTGQEIWKSTDPACVSSDFTTEGSTICSIIATREGTSRLQFVRASDGVSETHSISVPSDAHAFRFSPDGGRVAVITRGGAIHFLDRSTGQPAGPVLQLQDVPFTSGFSPDGFRYYANSRDNKLSVWDAVSGMYFAGPIPTPWLSWGAQLTVDHLWALTPEVDGRLQIWDIRPAVPSMWSDAHDLAKELRKLETDQAIRIALALMPEDPAILSQAGKTIRTNSAAGILHREFLSRRAASMTNADSDSPLSRSIPAPGLND